MVTRTTDIDHPDRNCVCRVCDRCSTVFFQCFHESVAYLDVVEGDHRYAVASLKQRRLKDLCRRCTEAERGEEKPGA